MVHSITSSDRSLVYVSSSQYTHMISNITIVFYTLVKPLFRLSKCSLAFIRNVAIEFVRISELLMVILTALSLPHRSVTSIVSDIFVECLSGDDGFEVCGDDDDVAVVVVVGKRIPTGGVIRTPCDGDIERFWGDDSGILLLFGGVCRCILFMDKLCGGP